MCAIILYSLVLQNTESVSNSSQFGFGQFAEGFFLVLFGLFFRLALFSFPSETEERSIQGD